MVSALNATVTDVLTRLTSLKRHADNLLAGINGIMNRTYDNELQQADEEYRKAQDVSALSMSARFNVTAQENLRKNLNDTAVQLERSLLVSMGEFDQLTNRAITTAVITDDAAILIIRTKVCSLHCDFVKCNQRRRDTMVTLPDGFCVGTKTKAEKASVHTREQ